MTSSPSAAVPAWGSSSHTYSAAVLCLELDGLSERLNQFASLVAMRLAHLIKVDPRRNATTGFSREGAFRQLGF
jgi:hypothetical protein